MPTRPGSPPPPPPRQVRIVGIDPGKYGGMAYGILGGGTCLELFRFDTTTEKDMVNCLKEWVSRPGQCHVFLEKVGSHNPHADGPAQGATSMFNFGQGYGMLRGTLMTLNVPFEEIQPTKWQREFGLLRTDKKETSTSKKNRHKQKAQQLFPEVKMIHAISDCILIYEYGRRLFQKGER